MQKSVKSKFWVGCLQSSMGPLAALSICPETGMMKAFLVRKNHTWTTSPFASPFLTGRAEDFVCVQPAYGILGLLEVAAITQHSNMNEKWAFLRDVSLSI